jgi:hypothetical protein
MIDKTLGDPRIDRVTTLAKPFGEQPIGTPVYLTTICDSRAHGYLSFPTPSPAALALNVAIAAAIEAENGKAIARFDQRVQFGTRKGNGVHRDDVGALFNAFEQCMIALTFSFQALEVFCNAIIGREMKGTHTIKRKNVYEALSPSRVERELSTEYKLKEVLPTVLSVKSPKGTRVWSRFTKLKNARDGSVHCKYAQI